MDFTDKRAVVTGAASGIGKALAERLAAGAARVAAAQGGIEAAFAAQALWSEDAGRYDVNRIVAQVLSEQRTR